jgi:hypothetical protein
MIVAALAPRALKQSQLLRRSHRRRRLFVPILQAVVQSLHPRPQSIAHIRKQSTFIAHLLKRLAHRWQREQRARLRSNKVQAFRGRFAVLAPVVPETHPLFVLVPVSPETLILIVV